MKKFTKISLIAAAVLAGLGIVLYGTACLLGAEKGIWKNGELAYGNWRIGSNGIYYAGDDEISWDDDASEVNTLSETYVAKQDISLSDVKSIELKIDSAELQIQEMADTKQISVNLLSGEEKYYSCSLKDGVLTVSYHDESRHYDDSPQIAILIPAGASFDTVTMDIGALAGEISMDKISCETMKINVGAGDFTAEKLTVTGKLEAVIGAGEAEIEDGEYQDVNLECGVGSITFTGAVAGNITGKCGMGDMELTLKGAETDYNYNVSCGLGDVEIGGTVYSNLSGKKTTENDGAVGMIDLDCGMGSIEVEFE